MLLPLWPDRPLEQDEPNVGCPSLTPYLLDGPGPFPLVIVVPGGGYARRAPHEAEPIARWLNLLGVAAVVLNYRVHPFQHPIPLQDGLRAVRMVRHYAQEWHVDPQRIGMLGFSAGGHLTATVGTHFDAGSANAADPIERQSSRPDLLILCYAVISFGVFAHSGSRTMLLGEGQHDQELIANLSNETQVSRQTPPTFLWHGVDDASVPVENSMLFAAALRRHQVPFALHLFPQARHGLGLAEGNPAVEWTRLCAVWLAQQWPDHTAR
ncbi:MAG: alpha/beta hydrolase [Roseiflexaceae bacterium]